MKTHPYLIALSLAVGTSLLGSSCSKKTQDTPTPTAESSAGPSITGLIEPADGILSVSLNDNATHQTITSATATNQGNYHFDGVPAGTYELNFNHKRGYVRPRLQSVTVASGKTTVVPKVTVTRSEASLTVNGIALNPTLVDLSLAFDGRGLPARSLFSIVLSNANTATGPGTFYLFLSMPYTVRVGTYSLNDASTYAIFDERSNEVFDSRLTSTIPLGGTLTITAAENVVPFPRTASGTFSFTGTSTLRGTQKTFSRTFTNAYF